MKPSRLTFGAVAICVAALFAWAAWAPATNYPTEPGRTIYWTNATGSAVTAGDVVAIGSRTSGIASVAIANGSSGSVYIDGVFRVDKRSAYTWSAGDALFWDGTYTTTTASTAYKFLGYATEAATSGQTNAKVLMQPSRDDLQTLGVVGNATVGGTLGITGATTFTGAVAANGGITVDTSAFTVADTSGNTGIAGTLTVTGATALNGGLSMDSTAFTVADTSGNTSIGGTLGVTGASTLTGGVTVGSGGTSLAKILLGTVTVENTKTSATLALTGVTAGSRVFAMATENASNAVYVKCAIPSTNSVQVIMSGDPGASNCDVSVLVIVP
jgi:predicted RecA/RadA family phage recombinase